MLSHLLRDGAESVQSIRQDPVLKSHGVTALREENSHLVKIPLQLPEVLPHHRGFPQQGIHTIISVVGRQRVRHVDLSPARRSSVVLTS